MRISFPRFVALASKAGNGSTRELVRLAILREVFLDGSLLKSELAQVMTRQKKRNSTVLARFKSLE